MFFGFENLTEAIEHLGMAFFRGFSHVAIDGKRFDLLESYNFSRDLSTGAWLWNPSGSFGGAVCVIPEDELVSIVRRRAIDYPAMHIYLRDALAEKDWGRFVERFGIPPAYLIEPPNATEEQTRRFTETAEALADGLATTLPHGSAVSFASEARGVNPFLEFVNHQQKLIVLLSTGGTLTSLAESGSGTLAGSAQMEVWDQIVRRDAELIGNALTRSVAVPFLRRSFPGQPILAEFSLGKDTEPTPEEMFDLATKAKAAGWRISKQEMEEATGYSLEEVAEPGAAMGMPAMQNSGEPDDAEDVVCNNDLNDDMNYSEAAVGAAESRVGGSHDSTNVTDAELAMSRDLQPISEALDRLSKLPDEEQRKAAKQMLENLEEYEVDASELADVMESAMAEAIAADSDTDKVENSEDCDAENGPSSCRFHGYSAAARANIGQTGDWKTLGLPSARDMIADPSVQTIPASTAIQRIKAGETVIDPRGNVLAIDNRTYKHIFKKGHKQRDIHKRLTEMPAALEAVKNPHEIWHDSHDGKTHRDIYILITESPKGKKLITTVENDGGVFSWYTNEHEEGIDSSRKGRLEWLREQ